MNNPIKARADAILPNLSEERQAALFEMMQPGSAKRTYDQIRAHVAKEWGIQVCKTSLGNWRAYYLLRLRYAAAEEARSLAVENRRSTHPQETEDEVFAFGQAIFADEAIKNADIKAWSSVQKLRLKVIDQSLITRRVALLEKKAAEADAAKAVIVQPLTEEEKMRHIKDIFGMP